MLILCAVSCIKLRENMVNFNALITIDVGFCSSIPFRWLSVQLVI